MIKKEDKYSFNPEKLSYEKVGFWRKNIVFIITVIISISVISYYQFIKPFIQTKIIEGEEVSTIITSKLEFSPEILREYLNEINVKFPDIVYAQAMLETGGFKSSIFKENSNLFGMKCARSRPFTHQGPNRGHAYYENWKLSCIDYALYQSSYLRDLRTKDQYYQYLGKHYAEDPNYISKLKQIISTYEFTK